ncbi:isoflavone 3'-hydroxylase-like [Phoenix dactylifera]|uniref:Isoflavone 3'-hydroxylase-like n=1 Tax=Phoenix dactylifera TaxID=42345 RepID=A0A8B8Z960_PHODC|nr:isoflavone 3'-hydroxylase-like [Phoenix dactylifera]
MELKPALFELALNIITRMIARKRYYGEESGVSEEARRFREIYIKGGPLFGWSDQAWDFLPLLRWVDFQGVTRRSISLQNRREKFLQRLIDEHRRKNNEIKEEEEKKTMIGDLQSLQKTDSKYYDDQMIKALCQSLLIPGTDPSSGAIVWAMSRLLNNPESLKKAQAEIDERVGNGRLLGEKDLSVVLYQYTTSASSKKLFG